MTFGRLKVIKATKRRDKNRHVLWQVECSCGMRKRKSGNALLSGKVNSCGCLQKELARKAHLLAPYQSIYNLMCTAAKSRNHQMDISYEEFVRFTDTKNCHYCWTPISWCRENRMHTKGGSSYYLDRKDNSLGYSLANCVVCCTRCNRGKMHLFTYEEWWAMTACFRKGKR